MYLNENFIFLLLFIIIIILSRGLVLPEARGRQPSMIHEILR